METPQFYRVFNRSEWIAFGWFTDEEIDSANELGFIGTKNGIDCYVSCPIPCTTVRGTNGRSK